MTKKRIKSKRKRTIDLTVLTNELYESICSYTTLDEILTDDYCPWKFVGVATGWKPYWKPFDKDDPKICKKVWDMHKKEVMDRWRADKVNAGSRPWLWWVCEANFSSKKADEIKKNMELKYLEEKGLLEDWEIRELEVETDYL